MVLAMLHIWRRTIREESLKYINLRILSLTLYSLFDSLLLHSVRVENQIMNRGLKKVAMQKPKTKKQKQTPRIVI